MTTVGVRMTSHDCFDVATWSASTPEQVVHALVTQLEAARAVWPEELEGYDIALDPPHRARDRAKAAAKDAKP